jgi:hypothetical protein
MAAKIFAYSLNTLKKNKTCWYLFSNKQAQGSVLSPSNGALLQHVQPAPFEALVWKNATKPL